MNREKLKEWIGQIGYMRLILLGVCGIFLIIVSLPEPEEGRAENDGITIIEENGENDLYIEKMEKRLEETLEKTEGVGKAEVMITLSASSEKIINKDLSYEQSTEQKYGEEETKKISEKREEETILSDKNGVSSPYVVKEMEPSVQGIIAVIEGGDEPVVIKEVTEAIEALFHVEPHKIKVLKMEDES